jgi:Surfeit locus protein 6
MAKLDPDNAKTAKDVMEERAAAALKRKRDEAGEDDYSGRTEMQREGLKLHDRKEKKRKTDQKDAKAKETVHGKADSNSNEDQKRRKIEKRAAKQAKRLRAQQKAERKKAQKEAALSNEVKDETASEADGHEEMEDDRESVDAIEIDAKAMAFTDDGHSTASPSPEIKSPIQSPQQHSGSSSISSIQPLILPPDQNWIPNPDTGKLAPSHIPGDLSSLTPERRLEARINALRAQRKADGPDGRQPRNRQELLEARRRKEQGRLAHKKELRRKAKEEEMRKQEEEIAKRFSPGGSGSLIASPRSPMDPGNNFSFGRVAFGDGTQVDSSLSSLLEQRNKKGASDAGTALKAAQNKASRLAGLDEEKRADIEQKDMWLGAKKKAHGERVRDDTSLLKKALKRQEGSKKRSETEWQGRIDGVVKSQEARQKKRQGNIAKRREEKGGGGKKKGGNVSRKGASGKKAKVKRPGFEGSFKTKPGGGGKK